MEKVKEVIVDKAGTFNIYIHENYMECSYLDRKIIESYSHEGTVVHRELDGYQMCQYPGVLLDEDPAIIKKAIDLWMDRIEHIFRINQFNVLGVIWYNGTDIISMSIKELEDELIRRFVKKERG